MEGVGIGCAEKTMDLRPTARLGSMVVATKGMGGGLLRCNAIEGKSKVHDSLRCALWYLSCRRMARDECNMTVEDE